MTECSSSTLERMHTAALAEFLEKGYQARVAARHRQTAGDHQRIISTTMTAKRPCSPHWWTSVPP